MPGSPRRRALTLTAPSQPFRQLRVLLATRASRPPLADSVRGRIEDLQSPPRPDRRTTAKNGGGGGRSGGPPADPSNPLDPLASLARGCADAAAWIVGKLVRGRRRRPRTSTSPTQAFLRQYAVVFAASTILTLVLWLLAVAKRAIRGVPLTDAHLRGHRLPLADRAGLRLHPAHPLHRRLRHRRASPTSSPPAPARQTDVFFGSFSAGPEARATDIGGGPIMLIVVSLVTILAAGVLWLELVIRAALLYVGALLGTVVYAGPRRQEHVGPCPPLGGHHDRGHPGQAGDRDRPRPGRRALLRQRPRRLLRRRLRPRHHPARHLRQRDDLPLRPRLRRRDRQAPAATASRPPTAPGRRRRSARPPPWSPRASRPTAPAAAEATAAEARQQRAGPARQPGRRRRRRPQLPHPAGRRRRTSPRRSAAAAAAPASGHPAPPHPGNRSPSSNSTGGDGR